MTNLEDEESDIRAFLARSTDYAGYVIDPSHRERPDFIVYNCGIRVGVEHTKVFQRVGSNTLQERETFEDQIVEMAMSSYGEKGGPPLDVDLSFSEHYPISSKEAPRLAAFIVEMLLQSLEHDAPPLMARVSIDRDRDDWDPTVTVLTYSIMPGPGFGHWMAMPVGWADPHRDPAGLRVHSEEGSAGQ